MSLSPKLISIIKTRLELQAVPAITDLVVSKILSIYDAELVGKAPKEDPTAPENIREDFINMLLASVEESMVVNDDGISFSIGDRSKLGYDGVTDPLSTLVFALEGFIEEYAFIPASVVRSRFKATTAVGRYDKGYLVSKRSFYTKGWDKFVDWNKYSLKYKDTVELFDISEIESEISNIIVNTITDAVYEFIRVVKNGRIS